MQTCILCIMIIFVSGWSAAARPVLPSSLPDAEAPAVVADTMAAVSPAIGLEPPLLFTGAQGPSMGMMLLQMLGSMAVIVVLIFGAAWLYRRLQHSRLTGDGDGRLIHVLGSTFIGPKKSICLVHVAGKVLVLGVTEGGMSTLASMNPEESQQVLNQLMSKTGAPGAFGSILDKMLGKNRQ